MMRISKTIWAGILSLVSMIVFACPVFAEDLPAQSMISVYYQDSLVSVDGVDEESDFLSVKGTTVTINKSGSYRFSGKCDDGNIVVSKDLGKVELVFDNLNLTSQSTAPLNLKGGNNTIIIRAVEGSVNTFTDTDRAGEKPKSTINASKSITFEGKGVIQVNANNKNGIKSDENIVVNDGITLRVQALDNCLSADNQMIINDGILMLSSKSGDGICSKPDVNEDGSLSASGDITINGGQITANVAGDCIQADHNLILNGGSFDLVSKSGYTSPLDKENESCKGLKAGYELTINDGEYLINTPDDAVHSDNSLKVIEGNMIIKSKDDGMHADQSLSIGDKKGAKPIIDIQNSKEGIESQVVSIYSGDISVSSTDDGINASDGNGEIGDFFIRIYGGKVNVNALADGLDSNGSIEMSGGYVTVFAAASNGALYDNSALDYETDCKITGGTLIGLGADTTVYGLNNILPTSGSQPYITYSGTILQNTNMGIKIGNTLIFTSKLPRQINHVLYCAPNAESASILTATSFRENCAHKSVKYLYKIGANRVAEGFSGDVYCSLCGKYLSSGNILPIDSKHVHKYSAWKTSLSATQFTTGIQIRTCSCGNKTTRTVAKKAGTVLKTAKNNIAGKIDLTWIKNTACKGYQIQYSTAKGFNTSNKYITISGNNTVRKTIASLKKGKTYYVRVRAYKMVSNKKVYSGWSGSKTIKITK